MAKLENKERIGILGGTFDPIHIGHLTLAKIAKETLALSKVILIPTRIPPHKRRTDIVAAELRYKMVELAISDSKFFCASKLEIEKPEVSYSIETLRTLKKNNPTAEFYFIVGSDALSELDTWKQINEIFELCKFVIAKRPGFRESSLPKEAILLREEFSSVSSSEIRKSIRSGLSVKDLVPEKVYQFIVEHSLYK